MKTFDDCVAKVKTCSMGNYVSYSLEANDCSWYSACEFNQLCADCSKPGPNCPNPATGGCPKYYPFESEVLKIGPPPSPSPSPSPSPGPPGPLPAGCYADDAHGPSSYKFAPGNVFPNEPNHGVKLVDSPAQCCKLCQTFQNCSFWTYSAGGTPSQPTCYSSQGACCFLKTDAAKGGDQPTPGVVSGSTKPYPPQPTGPLKVTVDWTTEVITTETAATVEVDVMPFLGEADWGGPFQGYKSALDHLDAEFVRFAPWFANPRVVVPELTPHVCSPTQPSTNWNSTCV